MHILHRSADFEGDLTRRTLASEGRRTRIIAWLLTGLAALAGSYGALEQWLGRNVPGFGWLFFALLAGCGYE